MVEPTWTYAIVKRLEIEDESMEEPSLESIPERVPVSPKYRIQSGKTRSADHSRSSSRRKERASPKRELIGP